MSESTLAFWSSSPLPEIPEASSYGGITLFSLSKERLLIVQQERGIARRFRIYNSVTKQFREQEAPLSNPDQQQPFSKAQIFLVEQ